MSKAICKLCNVEFTNLPAHLRTKHQLTEEEYNSLELEDLEQEQDTTIKIDPKPETADNTVKEPEVVSNSISLLDYLNQQKLTKAELDIIMDSYKHGKSISGALGLKFRKEQASHDAKTLAQQSTVETPNLYIAEELTKSYGFKVVTVKSGNPKKWILKK